MATAEDTESWQHTCSQNTEGEEATARVQPRSMRKLLQLSANRKMQAVHPKNKQKGEARGQEDKGKEGQGKVTCAICAASSKASCSADPVMVI